MRIAMFSSTLPEPELKPGGVDVLIERLCNALVGAGHAVRMHSFSPPPAGFRADHVQLGPARWRRSVPFRMGFAPLVFNTVDTSPFDVVHLHGEDWFYARRPVPTVRTFYGSAWDEARRATSLKRRASQTVFAGLELLSARLATSTYGLIPGDGERYGVRGALGCGVDLPEEASDERSSVPSILFVGTWEGRKRGRMLAAAFQDVVRSRHPNAELWMVSDQAEAHPGVRLFERPSDEELAELYRRAWVFCLPSSYEGFGIPYLEAMAAGTPVVATPNPGSDHLLNGGRSGLLVEDEDLGEALAALLDDDDRRQRLRTAGRTRAADFSWEKIVERHVRAYEAAWHAHPSPRQRSSSTSTRNE